MTNKGHYGHLVSAASKAKIVACLVSYNNKIEPKRPVKPTKHDDDSFFSNHMER